MNVQAPFLASDLEELHARLYTLADRVVPMRDIYKGDIGRKVIGLRHDVDDNKGSFDTALHMAQWECDHGYSSTYFLLHDSHYWNDDMLCRAPLFEELGHEVGLHVNGIAEGFRQCENPHVIVTKALMELRSSGVRVVGCVAHGDSLCTNGGDLFVNDEMFTESPRPSCGTPDRTIVRANVAIVLQPVSRAMYGLEYDATWLPRGQYLSDSGGKWSTPFDEVVAAFGSSQLHVLVHPDWWARAFAEVTV
jgi:hypothetical protein